MKPLLIVANFKSHLTFSEAKAWLENFSKIEIKNNKKVILCPPFTLLQTFKDFITKRNLTIELGAQNVSRLPQGPYTGEVNGAQIKDFANYVIIGHSERRQFGEDESVVEEKVKMAKDYNLTPILCVQSKNDKIPQEVSIVAYEPVFAIGTGNPDTPENANKISQSIKEKAKPDYILYGGSVNSSNVADFTSESDLSGILVGGASLSASEFLKIVENA